MAKELAHIKDFQIDDSALGSIGGSFKYGPLEIDYSVDLAAPSVSVTVKLAGVTIGSGTLTPANARLKLGGGVAGFKAEVVLTADFDQSQVTYDATVCVPIKGCQEKKGILVSW